MYKKAAPSKDSAAFAYLSFSVSLGGYPKAVVAIEIDFLSSVVVFYINKPNFAPQLAYAAQIVI